MNGNNRYRRLLEENRNIPNFEAGFKTGTLSVLQEFIYEGLYNPNGELHSINDAINEINNESLLQAKKWYEIGSKDGFVKCCQSVHDGEFDVIERYNFIEIISKKNHLKWQKDLLVKLGNIKKLCKINNDLDFEEVGFKFCRKDKYKFTGSED